MRFLIIPGIPLMTIFAALDLGDLTRGSCAAVIMAAAFAKATLPVLLVLLAATLILRRRRG